MKLQENGSNYNEWVAALPVEALPIFRQLETDSIDHGLNFEQCKEYLNRLERFGVTFDYELTSEPFDFEILTTKEVEQ